MRRGTTFPWFLVGAGALVFWTVALGVGIPSLARLLGVPGPAQWAVPAESRCVATATVDGRAYEFGDCINVRFMLDSPELARPAHAVPARRTTPGFLVGPDAAKPATSPDLGGQLRAPEPSKLGEPGQTSY
jgi:hypothetical protein